MKLKKEFNKFKKEIKKYEKRLTLILIKLNKEKLHGILLFRLLFE